MKRRSEGVKPRKSQPPIKCFVDEEEEEEEEEEAETPHLDCLGMRGREGDDWKMKLAVLS